jgi:hypothetical protein
MTPLRVLLLLCVLLGSAHAAPIAITATPVDLDSENPANTKVGPLRYLGGLVLKSGDERFGGLSGLVVGDDGRLVAVSDRGYWFEATLERDATGRLVGLANARYSPMLNEAGGAVQTHWLTGDAEALQRDGNDLVVAFERRHRLWRYDARGDLARARPRPVPLPDVVTRLPRNGGIEALAVLGPGRLLAIGEEPLDGREDAPVNTGWIVGPDGVVSVNYPNTSWRPTDAARLPNGDLLVLERRFFLIAGFASRIKRIPATAIVAGGMLDGEVIARLEPPLLSDNFEGIAIVAGPGPLRIYLLSDDNFRFLQRTLLLEFAWED